MGAAASGRRAVKNGGVCKHCGRGIKVIFTELSGGKQFEFVQTCGGPPPEWVLPMRRVEK